MASQIVKAEREKLETCMTCPLCNKLLKEAKTMCLCLHMFCRKCIYEKLLDQEVNYYPVCKLDLGCLQFEKHKRQGILAQIFPLKRGKINAFEAAAMVARIVAL